MSSVTQQPVDEEEWSGAVSCTNKGKQPLGSLFVFDGVIDMGPVLWCPLLSPDSVPGMQVSVPSSFPGTAVPPVLEWTP